MKKYDQLIDLKGKFALVTGSSSGIGLAIAEALASAGAGVVLNGRAESEGLHQNVERLKNLFDVDVSVACGDLADEKEVPRVIDRAREATGGLDILVNNAGIQHVAPIEDFPPEKWSQIVALNLSAAFHTTRLSVPAMKERGFGRIINIASAHGLVASPFKAAYVAAKHGLLGLTKVTALEGAEHGITCNAICPGYVMTPLVENQIDAQAKAHGIDRERVIEEVILAPQPLKRFAEPAEIGALAVFLCGGAGSSITGAALPVDGAWTAR